MGNLATFRTEWGAMRDAMRKAYSEYSEAVSKMEKHQGSAYGDEQLAKAREKYEAAMRMARERYGGRIGDVLQSMKAAMEAREAEQSVKVPTDEQVRVLQVLQLRSSMTVSEYQTYHEQMRDCDMASKALHDIAVSKMPEGTNLEPRRTLQGSAWEQAKELSRQAKTLARWDGGTERGSALRAHLDETRDKGGEGYKLSLNNVQTDTSRAFHSAATAGIDPTSKDFYKEVIGGLLYDEKALELLD